jgi:hypothetical protein
MMGLAESQLRAKTEIDTSSGLRFRLKFKDDLYKARI